MRGDLQVVSSAGVVAKLLVTRKLIFTLFDVVTSLIEFLLPEHITMKAEPPDQSACPRGSLWHGGEQTRKALLDRLQKLGIAMDVEEALLLPREARSQQVLGGRRRADGDVGEVRAGRVRGSSLPGRRSFHLLLADQPCRRPRTI
jgi:hypothetical protein